MSIDYAVERLYEAGWSPWGEVDLKQCADGRKYPSILTIRHAFARAGLEFSIKHNLIFNCYQATWAPIGQPLDAEHAAEERHGTVVGSCESEAAVYALAHLRAAQSDRQLANV